MNLPLKYLCGVEISTYKRKIKTKGVEGFMQHHKELLIVLSFHRFLSVYCTNNSDLFFCFYTNYF